MKTEGLFRRITREGVSSTGGRRIRNERLGMDPGEREENWLAEIVMPAAKHHGRRRKLADELGYGPTGHGMHIRGHREEAGKRGIKAGPKRWSEGAAVVAVAMDGGRRFSARAATVLGTI